MLTKILSVVAVITVCSIVHAQTPTNDLTSIDNALNTKVDEATQKILELNENASEDAKKIKSYSEQKRADRKAKIAERKTELEQKKALNKAKLSEKREQLKKFHESKRALFKNKLKTKLNETANQPTNNAE